MARHGKSRSSSFDRPRSGSSANEDFYIYGVNPVSEALKSGAKIKALFINKQSSGNMRNLIELAGSGRIPVTLVEKDFFDSRFDKGHQGIAASVSQKKIDNIENIIDRAFSKKSAPLFIILDCIEDPHNFGAILRVADAAGVDGVVFQTRRSASLTPTVYKASAGAIHHIDLAEVVNIKHAIALMKDRDVTIVGAEADAPLNVWDVDLKTPMALIVGSEGEGMRRTVKDMCDIIVRLPMKGVVNSLNVSVATGIIAYEAMRQRTQL
ncbi:MAG TPA: 23S rRNA (guanosine(2251)-2'-O)-methyltransferase RlmB [Dissulfurispiraceae bacterium]|nr:23S rRNA (guanosine(2251)-2'-O)-methyltransferase RlmB [Dissulfurispiraceae bacterium]